MAESNTGTSEFYIPESRRTFLKKVQSGLSQGKIMVMEGPTGVGKTVLLEEILTSTLPNANKCYVTPARGMSDIQIRSRIIEQLFGNVLFDPEMPLVTSFIEFNQPQQILITIDNCQYLSGRLVGELLQLFSEASNLSIDLTLVLALDKSMNSTLLNVNSRLVTVLSVPMLNKQESYELLVEYIADIPAQNNYRVKRWIDNSAGLPIQLLAYGQKISTTQRPQDEEETAPLNVKLWGSLLVLASLVLALGIYVYRIGLTQPQEPVNKQAIPVEQKPGTVDKVVKEWKKDQAKGGQATLSQPQTSSESDNQAPAFSLDEKPMAQVTAMPMANSEAILADILGESIAPEPDKSAQKRIAKQVEQNPTTDLILSELTKEQAGLSEEQQKQAEDQLLKELQQEQVNSEQSLALLPQSSANEAKAESKEAQVSKENTEVSLDFFLPEGTDEELKPARDEDSLDPQIVSSSTEEAIVDANASAYFIDNQLFMSLPADRFVLQLTAVSNEVVLSEYLASAPVPVEELRIYRIKRKKSDWIVVTYGLFETIEQARQAAKVVEPNAWAKSISVIQQQILAFQKAQEQ